MLQNSRTYQKFINAPTKRSIINHLLDLTWAIAILFLINLVMNHSKVESKVFNIKHL